MRPRFSALRDIKFLHQHSYISFNGILYSPNEFDERVSRHVECLLSVDSLDVISVVGPCMLLQYSGRFFAVCTRHQLLKRDPEWIGINDFNNRVINTCGGVYWLKDPQKMDLEDDLVIFDYTDSVAAGNLLQANFLPIDQINCIRDGD